MCFLRGIGMAVNPFLTRELILSIRRRTAFRERAGVVGLMAAGVAGAAVAWDWQGWDRTSAAGAGAFALLVLGLLLAVVLLIGVGVVGGLVAAAVARERDRKTLDALLATPLSARSVILGVMGAGLLRWVNSLLALGPVAVGLVWLGGIDPRLILLTGAGVVATALAIAALAAVVTVESPDAGHAGSLVAGGLVSWFCLPLALVILLPRAWAGSGPWVAPVGLVLLDSSPVGPSLSFVGVIARGSLVETVPRMIALELAAAAVLAFWAVVRLRPAARAFYDADGRTALRRILRARWRKRPPCGNDPVLWRELHSARPVGAVDLALDRLYKVAGVIGLTWLVSCFAVPAFAEIPTLGYGPLPGRVVLPDPHPLARLLVARLTRLPVAPLGPGQARLELEVMLRHLTLAIGLLYPILVAGFAMESVAAERERDTWLGLIATPLSGAEILRAKMLGAIWKARLIWLTLLALWIVGALAGAVHPLGLLVAVLGLAVSSWFIAAVGVACSLRLRDRQGASLAVLPVIFLQVLSILPFASPAPAVALLVAGLIPFQGWAALLAPEDVRAIWQGSAAPHFATVGVTSGAGTGAILASWLISTLLQLGAAVGLTRRAARGFDAAVGRPVRGRAEPARDRRVARPVHAEGLRH